jgi:predicted ATPase/DNA-binding SARP family transcriptional activator
MSGAASMALPWRCAEVRGEEGPVPEIAVLGAVAVVDSDGRDVAPRSGLQRTLLALLVACRDRVVGADELVDVLWGDRLPARPTAALQSQVFRLRRLLGDPACITTEATGYRLRLPADRIDACRFEHLVADACRGGDRMKSIERYEAALALWRGRAYADALGHPAVDVEASRLEELRAAAAEERAELLIATGRPAEAAAAMDAVVAEHPFREQPVAVRMRALATCGRHADAVRAFAAFRRTLGDELGLEPSPKLAAIEAEILRHELGERPAIGLPGNSLFGRERDLADVASALASCRVVTLTGPGGVGKTRLALHAAARAAETFPDGTFLVELADVATSDAVAPAAAAAFGIEDVADITRIARYLQTRTALVVLDNCEHVLDGVRPFVTAMLTRAPAVVVLATSRRRLGVDGEHVRPVEPLPPAADDDIDAPAVALFAERAAALQPGFTLDATNAAAVATVCRHLAGLPLAIELAAARIVAHTPTEILAEVTAHTDRVADRHRGNARHRSLAAVLDWSEQLLDPVAREVFATIAVLAGGFTADAANAVVAGDSATATNDALTDLVEHSLLRSAGDTRGTRYTMLEPVRQHAFGRLPAARVSDIRARHAAWFAGWVRTADAGLRGADEAVWARAIADEVPNLRVAHQWALANDLVIAAQIAGDLYWYAYWYGGVEIADWATSVVERDPHRGPAVSGVYASAVLGAWRRGDLAAARSLAARGVDLAGDDASARFVWEALSSTNVVRGDYDAALECQATALDLATQAGERTQVARERAARALTLGYLGRPADARAELDLAIAAAHSAANPTAQAFCDYVAGELQLDAAPRDALASLIRARDAGRALGNRYLTAIAGLSAASCRARTGHASDVLSDYAELLDYFEQAGAVAQQWTAVRSLIAALTDVGNDEAAVILLGALDASATAAPLIGSDAERIDRVRRTLRRRLGARASADLTARGAALDDPHALALARHSCRTPAPSGPSPTPRSGG